mgnify:CR=1 FL=1
MYGITIFFPDSIMSSSFILFILFISSIVVFESSEYSDNVSPNSITCTLFNTILSDVICSTCVSGSDVDVSVTGVVGCSSGGVITESLSFVTADVIKTPATIIPHNDFLFLIINFGILSSVI